MADNTQHSRTEPGYPANASDSGLGGTPHDAITDPAPMHSQDSGEGESGSQPWLPNHPKTGDWYSLKGTVCGAYEHPSLHSETFENMRGQDPSMAPSWDESILDTGVTSPEGGMYSSELENHSGYGG